MRSVVVGLGRMGMRHLQILTEGGHEIVGIADPRPEALAEARDKFALREGVCFADAKAMLGQVRPACAIIATTAPAHCELTVMAAQQGASHILCEKPMAVSLAECDAMIDACEKSGTLLAINHQMRFMEQ